ncbi:hypothetical protein HPP92_004311 [Vanilla planifolia]|uniref:Uncharacterized protein n=1 Tax=Vanilla planifolia TaxID=51239 RepID=A0A835S3E7_VANPL|nr:hypothetical protein HPP92_004311 [Vanilla planifolia]
MSCTIAPGLVEAYVEKKLLKEKMKKEEVNRLDRPAREGHAKACEKNGEKKMAFPFCWPRKKVHP